jgi:hypothetical protein
MKKNRHLAGVVAALMVAAAVMALPSIASAHTGEYSKFNNCPSTNEEVTRCINSEIVGGEVVLGKKKVPIVNPAVLQGGYGKANLTTHIAKFYGATNGETLSKAPQPVPGGLAGLVNCKEVSNFILKAACEWTFENGLTGVNSTLELAQPASEIEISEYNLLFRKKTALKLPVKVHLENPLLGSSCYIGSSSEPLIWNLTTGTTAPPAPNEPISGATGKAEVLEEGGIVKYNGTHLVDNAWSAPGANGCGGPIAELLLDPIINLSVGVPAVAGTNSSITEANSYLAASETVNEH